MNDSIEELIKANEEERNAKIAGVNQKADQEKNWLESVARLKAKKYPDLHIVYSSDRSVRYLCSKEINSRPDARYNTGYGYGCRPNGYGDRIELSLYIEDEESGRKIYGSPRSIDIGQASYWCVGQEFQHDQAKDGLAEDLRKHGLSENIISRICAELEENAIENCGYCNNPEYQ